MTREILLMNQDIQDVYFVEGGPIPYLSVKRLFILIRYEIFIRDAKSSLSINI